METKINILEQFLGVITKTSEWIERYGIFKLFRTAFTIFLLYWMCVLAFQPSKIFEKYAEWYDKIHTEKIERTLESHYQIQGYLTDLRYKTDAMRTLVLSLHNGASNINGNYQFLKVSAIFEECGDYFSVSEEWSEVHISTFPIFNYLYSTDFFCGSMDELRKIDNKLYHRLMANNVGYIHIQALIGENGQTIGFLVLTWENEPENHLALHNDIYKASNKISRLMD